MSNSNVLRLSAFRNLWLGQTISQMGDSFFYVAFMFMVQRVTGSYAMVGFVGACETAPYLLFSLYGGVLADRMDRRRIMLASDLMCGAILCALAALVWVLGKPPVWSLLVTPFLLSTVRTCFLPAKNAAIPSIVPADRLMEANALSSTTQNIAPILSLSLSAGILSLIYERSPSVFLICAVLLNSLSFWASAYFIYRLPKIEPDRNREDHPHPWTDLKDGIRYIRTRHALIVLFIVQAGLTLSISPFFVVYVAANKEWLGGRPVTLAICELMFFVGMVLGSIVVGKLKFDAPGKGFVFGIAGVGLAVLAMAFSRTFGLFLVWNLVAGLVLPFSTIPITVWLQVSTPNAYQGRVNSILAMLQFGMQPLGMALGGVLVARLGIATAFIAMGVGMAIAGLTGLIDRQFRNLQMPVQDSTPQVDPDSSIISVG